MQPGGERVAVGRRCDADHVVEHAGSRLGLSAGLVEHGQPSASASVLRKIPELLDELLLRLGIAFEPCQRVGGVEVQLVDLQRARLLQLVDSLQETGQRISVLALIVEQPRVDENRQRQRGILHARQTRLLASRVRIALRERDFRQHFVRGRF